MTQLGLLGCSVALVGLALIPSPPLIAIFAVADAFDAMTSDRPYRKAKPFSDARARPVGASNPRALTTSY